MSERPLVHAKGLRKYFTSGGGFFGRGAMSVKAVDGIDLDIYEGQTVGIVGESGSGKSTLGRLLIRLLTPTAGTVEFDGHDLGRLSRNDLRELRKEMQFIFQDPYASLNPRMRVGRIIGEGIETHRIAEGSEVRRRVCSLLERVGLPAEAYDRYPHEFSGGQRQRVGIARALAVEPRFIVADEPVSALDISIQAQILNLIVELQKDLNLTFAFISHDLRVVEHISDRVAVMYLGKVVEEADSGQVYSGAKHPYTKALLSSVPRIDPAKRAERVVLAGDVPSPMAPPPGCTFHPRCPIVEDGCRTKIPALDSKAEAHRVACDLV